MYQASPYDTGMILKLGAQKICSEASKVATVTNITLHSLQKRSRGEAMSSKPCPWLGIAPMSAATFNPQSAIGFSAMAVSLFYKFPQGGDSASRFREVSARALWAVSEIDNSVRESIPVYASLAVRSQHDDPKPVPIHVSLPTAVMPWPPPVLSTCHVCDKTHIVGYAAGTNPFLFDRGLNKHVPGLVSRYAKESTFQLG